ncbi:AI-2E family transporter [Actinomyces vulturis]|uniref:AI-2E family transporter n=1 Tax=Actinomyces vulturis TaxID=1857645 RepID=UPI0009F4B549|nr:AI-2E family transporter [Actinomyces vulturis]
MTSPSSRIKTRNTDQPIPLQSATRSQGETFALTLAALTVGAGGLWLARSIVGPAFFALTLVITVHPLMTWLVKKKVPRWLAAVCGVGVIYLFVLGLFAALGASLTQFIYVVPKYADQLQTFADSMMNALAKIGVDEAMIMKQVETFDTNKIVGLASSFVGQVSNVSSLLLLLMLTVAFLTFDVSQIEARSRALARIKPEIYHALEGFSSSVRSYWLVSTIFGLIVAVLDVGALFILGVPMAITWGVVSFITNYIPNIGFVIGVIPPALLGLVSGGPWTALWVIVSYSVLNFVIQSLIQPKFTGDAVGLNTTITFLSLVLWTLIIGGLGAILAVPLTLLTKSLLIDSDPDSRWLTIFLTDGDKDPYAKPRKA